MGLKTLRSQLLPLDFQGSERWKISGISSGLSESLQFAEFESQMEISPLNSSCIFKLKKKSLHERYEKVDHYT